MNVIRNAGTDSEGLVPIFMRSVLVHANEKGLTIFISHEDGTFVPSDIRLGSRGDSYYEYLL
jgi:mannosyl-oligosaccharide alpha-1,2-mannosidase